MKYNTKYVFRKAYFAYLAFKPVQIYSYQQKLLLKESHILLNEALHLERDARRQIGSGVGCPLDNLLEILFGKSNLINPQTTGVTWYNTAQLFLHGIVASLHISTGAHILFSVNYLE